MPKTHDFTGKRFGRLIALRIVGKHGSNMVWECKCDCGNLTKTTATSLNLGNTKSCGCFSIESRSFGRYEYVGKKFNRLTVIREVQPRNGRRYVYAVCECGTEREFHADNIKTGRVKSCGCLAIENVKKKCITHGQSANKLYFVWYSMMTRCYNPDFEDYHNYGGRGIRVCDEWFDMIKFIDDVTPGYFRGLQLDRIDNDGNYSKFNCRWVTRKQNNRNKRTNVLLTFNNQTHTIVEWCEIYNLSQSPVRERLKKGYTPYEVLFGKIRHDPSKMLPHLFK